MYLTGCRSTQASVAYRYSVGNFRTRREGSTLHRMVSRTSCFELASSVLQLWSPKTSSGRPSCGTSGHRSNKPYIQLAPLRIKDYVVHTFEEHRLKLHGNLSPRLNRAQML